MSTVIKPKRREFLQLAKTYDPSAPPRGGYSLGGWYSSEKLDGQRGYWDGGLTRGMNTVDVPWASVINPKTGELKKKIKPIATGLWSRYGNPIVAPDWFLNGLPAMPLDGELFAGRGNFQSTRSVVSKDAPIDSEWKNIQFAVYGSPSFEAIFCDGEIKNANFHCMISWPDLNQWIKTRASNVMGGDFVRTLCGYTFEQELTLINEMLETQTDFAYLHQQVRLPLNNNEAVSEIERRLDKVLDLGGEGLIIRSAEAVWHPKRMPHILKYKPHFDGEATVTSFTSGRLGKEGTLQGKIGAIVTNYKGKKLNIAGMTHTEREFSTPSQVEYAQANPGELMPADFSGKYFKVGDIVTFKYRELSDDGIPKDARYFRKA